MASIFAPFCGVQPLVMNEGYISLVSSIKRVYNEYRALYDMNFEYHPFRLNLLKLLRMSGCHAIIIGGYTKPPFIAYRVNGFRVALVSRDEFSAVGFVRIFHVVCRVAERSRYAPPAACVYGYDACCCYANHLRNVLKFLQP